MVVSFELNNILIARFRQRQQEKEKENEVEAVFLKHMTQTKYHISVKGFFFLFVYLKVDSVWLLSKF